MIACSLALAFRVSGTTTPDMGDEWRIAVSRTDQDGELLSRTMTPVALLGEHDAFVGRLVVDMGKGPDERFWELDFECDPLGGIIRFDVADGGVRLSSFHEGTRSVSAANTHGSRRHWRGPGRYRIFTLDNEVVSAVIGPVSEPGSEPEDHPASRVIEIVRRDSDGELTGRASTGWFVEDEDEAEAHLSLYVRNPDDALVPKRFRCWLTQPGNGPPILRVRVYDVDTSGKRASSSVQYDLRLPYNLNEERLVYDQDGERVSVIIRDQASSEKQGEPSADS